jgi:hypothetical protein
LSEIAKGYGVAWLPEPSFTDTDDAAEDAEDGNGADGGVAAGISGGGDGTGKSDESVKKPEAEDKDVVEDKDQADSKIGKADVPPPPAGPEKDAWSSAAPAKKLSEEEELAKRFERLKKL